MTTRNNVAGIFPKKTRPQIKATSASEFSATENSAVKRLVAAVGRQLWLLSYRLGEIRERIRAAGRSVLKCMIIAGYSHGVLSLDRANWLIKRFHLAEA